MCILKRLSLTIVAMLCSAVANAMELYVAVNGNDAWSGRLPKANSALTDGPFATIERAQKEARQLKADSAVTVLIRGGTHILHKTLVLEPQDSGTADRPVVYAAYPGEQPILSGGRQIVGWQRGTGKLWQVELPEVRSGKWSFRQLFVDGERRQRARSPNTGYHRIAALLPGPPNPRAKPVARDKFIFAAADLQPWDQLHDVNVVLMHSWETSIHPLKSVDTVSNTVQFTAPMKEWWSIGYWEEAQRYYVENAFELLDQPGEWYLNRATGVLSYWPLPGEQMEQIEVVAPVLHELVRLAGDAEQGRFVEYVTLRGLAFHHADWILAPQGNSSTQAAVEVPAAVMADGALNCAIEGCEVAHVGTYGIWFRRGCKDCRIQRNRAYDLGAGGIRVGEAKMAATDVAESCRILVDNNHIYDGGHVYAAGVGIWVAQSSENRISHNDIHDLCYSGISIGWNWGLEANRTHHNVVEFNHVHDLVHGVLSDAGLIYCLGVSPGSVIRNNVFHDIWPYSTPPLGWGIYLDAQCGGYTVENNLVYNTLSGGLMFNNGGHEHLIQNNIFALSANHALWPYNEKRPSTFQRNIVYLTQGELLIPHGQRSLNERLAAQESLGIWDENLYWHTGGADRIRFYRHSLEAWQALGLDRKSSIADPQFADVAAHDFTLQPGSPALRMGFLPLEISGVGLYGDAAWVSEVSHANCPHRPLPPPPPPLTMDDDFEKTPLGATPSRARVSGEEQGASIRISDQRSVSGRQSLRVTDSKDLQPAWEPHFYYEPHLREGIIRQSFDLRFDSAAQLTTEWRDIADYPRNVGPSVSFDGRGQMLVAGKVLAQVPSETWLHIEIEAVLGKDAPRTFRVTLQVEGGERRIFADLPISGVDFRELHWLGFSSTATADTVFFIDNLKFGPVTEKGLLSSFSLSAVALAKEEGCFRANY
ncbi:MAG: right-handed parallel beta-helix repeat-containing protein [Kiritimatiellae bacterium]|nr:right-handed parallel beta-helix repeat-containing protein [Kiritimatiellia bacterium]